MIARWKKALAATAACALFAGGLAACGDGTASDGDVENMTLVVWASQEDQANEDSWLQTMEQAFEEEHPEYNITWKNQVVASADAAGVAKQDPTVAADVYTFASDQLGTLLDAGAIGQVSDDTMAQLEEQTEGSETMLDTVKGSDGNVYGVPLAGNTWFMYYRKSKFSDEDIKSLDAMLAKGKVSFPLTNSWYLPAFYIGAGGTLFGEDGTDAESGVQFGGETGAAVTDYLVSLRENPNFVLDANGSGLAGLKDGSVDVVFTGNWDAATVRANLGDDWGVAQLPCFTLNGQQVQMKAFAGSTVYAWNPYSKHPKAADQFAAFLSGTYSQQAHYEMRSVIPSDVIVAATPEVEADAVAQAQIDTIANTSVVQPSLSEMSNFWTPCENFGKAIYNGEVTHDNAAQQTESWMASYESLM
ncbi:extracellular solute-binding protein [Bifidobacterium phasiani]|uniref:ABC transporter substrate-binding protein n=1 Tax=Bifidobacterium phasiani TaxID=2834431 RepID=A0ABS6W831_9BIFI|nr:extracellular solute-binding protein [Bifidobacterium phasiani]MBW3082658.1 ABC transporter substrate-binding protein [Bifidobacterium phasiani]